MLIRFECIMVMERKSSRNNHTINKCELYFESIIGLFYLPYVSIGASLKTFAVGVMTLAQIQNKINELNLELSVDQQNRRVLQRLGFSADKPG